MNIEQRITRLEESLGHKRKVKESFRDEEPWNKRFSQEIPRKLKNLKIAHQYTIRNLFEHKSNEIKRYGIQVLKREGISEQRLKQTKGLSIDVSKIYFPDGVVAVNIISNNRDLKSIRIKNPDPLYGGKDILYNYIQAAKIKLGFTKRDYLDWENSLFLALYEHSEETGMPYSGAAAKQFLIDLAEKRINELDLTPTKSQVNPKLEELMSSWELQYASILRKKSSPNEISTYDLDQIVNGTYKIDSNGVINVQGDVHFRDFVFNNRNDSILKNVGQFGIVTGEFYLIGCESTSLEGLPSEVGSFAIHNENIRNLVGIPRKIKGDITIAFCDNLVSFKGLPKVVNGDLKITHYRGYDFLDGLSEVVKGNLNFVSKTITKEEILEVCDVQGTLSTKY